MPPLREEVGPSSSSTISPETTNWVTDQAELKKLIHKDFAPSVNPDYSSCWSKGYSNFSECVQSCNEWLQNYECELISCETVPLSSPLGQSTLADTWPRSTYIRGLRIWVLVSDNFVEEIDEENSEEENNRIKLKNRKKKQPGHRTILGFRDFTPSVEGKSMFTDEYEDVHALLHKVNFYLSDRSTPAKVLNLQTIDAPTAGVYELEFDTEESRVSTSQHGYTRICRFLRLFFLVDLSTMPEKDPTLRDHGYLRVAPSSTSNYDNQNNNNNNNIAPLKADEFILQIKDFIPSTEDHLSNLLNDATIWSCKTTRDSTLLNIQVLPLRVGKDTSDSSWTLDSPGHLPNKFKSFIRLIYTTCKTEEPTEGGSIEDVSSESERITKDHDLSIRTQSYKSLRENINENEDSKTEISSVSAPGMIEDEKNVRNIAEDSSGTTKSYNSKHLLSIKTIIPEIISSAPCGSPEREHMEDIVTKANEWVKASDGQLIDVHTHYVYNAKNISDIEKGDWVRYASRGSWLTVLHMVILGGIRAPKTSPLTMAEDNNSFCTIL